MREVAPGVDLQFNIIDQMDFVPTIAEPLGTMNADHFRDRGQ